MADSSSAQVLASKVSKNNYNSFNHKKLKKTIMKKATKFLCLGMIVASIPFSCGKDNVTDNHKTEVLHQIDGTDAIDLITSNPERYFNMRNKKGVETLLGDLQLTDEQLQDCYQELHLVEQLVATSSGKRSKYISPKNVQNNDIDTGEIVTADVLSDAFNGMANLMIAYVNVKGASAQWQSILEDFILSVGAIMEKIRGGNIVVMDMDSFLQEEFAGVSIMLFEKYSLTEEDGLHLTTMIDNTYSLISSGLRNNTSYSVDGKLHLQKSFWSSLKNVGKIVLSCVVFSVGIAGGILGGKAVCGPYCGAAGGVGGFYAAIYVIDNWIYC
jgi:hypothetical protein